MPEIGAAWKHKGGLAGWGVKDRFRIQFTPYAASLYLLPQPYHVIHRTVEWHLGRTPKGSSCLTQYESLLCSLPSGESLCTQLVAGRSLLPDCQEDSALSNAPPGFLTPNFRPSEDPEPVHAVLPVAPAKIKSERNEW